MFPRMFGMSAVKNASHAACRDGWDPSVYECNVRFAASCVGEIEQFYEMSGPRGV